MNLLGFLVIGLIAGWAAGKMMKGRGFGAVGDIVVGLVGSVLGGYVFGLLGISAFGVIGSFATAFVGSLVLIFLVGMLKKTNV